MKAVRLGFLWSASCALVAIACGGSDSTRKPPPGKDAGPSAGAGGSAAGAGGSGTGAASPTGGHTSAGGASSGGASGGTGGSPAAGGGTPTSGSPNDGGADARAGGGGSGVRDASVDASDGSSLVCAVDGVSCSARADGSATCCGGACVPGDCCHASDCGSSSDAGGAGYLCQDHRCIDVAGSLSGLLWELPCTSDVSSTSCDTTSATTQTAVLGGAPGVTYDVNLHFRGIVEQKTYAAGCPDGSYWLKSGASNGDSFNVYALTVSSPPQTYFLNRGTSSIENTFVIDYQETIRADAGAKITLFADPVDGQEIQNRDASGTAETIADTPVPQPYDGQFIQMDVVSVSPDPYSSHPIGDAGSAGSALSFNGSELATVSSAASLEPADLTLEAWFNLTEASGSYSTIFGKTYGTGSVDSYTLWYQSGAMYGAVAQGSTSGAPDIAWSTFGQWHHAAFTFDHATQTQAFYVDGIVSSCTTGTAPSYDDHAVLIGADVDNGSVNGYWDGSLDEIRIFSAARTSDQIWADMHTAKLGPTAGLVAEWTFDEGTGQTAADSSGNGNAAVLGSTTATEANDPAWVTSGVLH